MSSLIEKVSFIQAGDDSREEFFKEQDLRAKQIENDAKENRNKLIPMYLALAYVTWISLIVFTMCVVSVNGIKNDLLKFSTSDDIVMRLMTLTIGGSSITTIGAKYLFNEKRNK